MNKNKIELGSLAMDLKRVALGYQQGSEKTAVRFCKEAKSRIDTIDQKEIAPYIRNALSKIKVLLNKKGKAIAEDALMYSTIFQNYALSS